MQDHPGWSKPDGMISSELDKRYGAPEWKGKHCLPRNGSVGIAGSGSEK